MLLQPQNQGKGAALRTRLRRGDRATSSSSRTPTSSTTRATSRSVIQPIVDGIADVVFGSRFIGKPRRVLYFWHTVVNNALTLLSNMFTT